MPGGDGNTGEVRTPVLPGFGKGRLLRLLRKRGTLSTRRCSSAGSGSVFVRLLLRSGSALPYHSSTAGNPRRGGEHRLQVPKTPPWRTRRPSQPDLRSSPKPPCRCCRKRSGKRWWPVLVPRFLSSDVQVPGGQRQPAQRRVGGACVRVLGRQPSPPQPQRQRLPLPKRARLVLVPGGGPSLAEQPRLRLPRFLPLALPRPRFRSCCREAPGGRAAQSAHGGGRRRPGSGRPCGREARAETLAPLSAFARLLPAPHSSRSHPFPA